MRTSELEKMVSILVQVVVKLEERRLLQGVVDADVRVRIIRQTLRDVMDFDGE